MTIRKPSRSAAAEDAVLAAEIAKAQRFSACIHLGPGNRQTVYTDSYAAALAAKAEMDAGSRFGRRAVVYAINSLGSFPVDDRLAKMAGLVA